MGVYLHWNGGRDSVEAFLAFCKLKGYHSPEQDNTGWARLCQVIGNYFGKANSVEIDKCSKLDCDNFDNGVYIIEKWKIVGRQFAREAEQNRYPLREMLKEINEKQPKSEQLDEKLLDEYCTKRNADKLQSPAGIETPANSLKSAKQPGKASPEPSR